VTFQSGCQEGSTVSPAQANFYSFSPLHNVVPGCSVLRECCTECERRESIKRSVILAVSKMGVHVTYSYVSAMVPVKTMKEYELLQDLTVLFCETVDRYVLCCITRLFSFKPRDIHVAVSLEFCCKTLKVTLSQDAVRDTVTGHCN